MQKISLKNRLIYLVVNDDVLEALVGRKAVKTSPEVFPTKRSTTELGNKMV
jgi:hypothetical protein